MLQSEIVQDNRLYPIGLTRLRGAIHVSVKADAREVSLLLYSHAGRKNGQQEKPTVIPFPAGSRTGDVWEMTLRASGLDAYDYAFEADGVAFPDPCGASFTGHEVWGDFESASALLKSPIRVRPFDWEGDKPPAIPYEKTIVYRAHVRGFTRHPSSRVHGRGTFMGIAEKIPYLTELGITTLELMPVTEFSEVVMPQGRPEDPQSYPSPTGILNYWGYCPAFLFAPKASYAGAKNDPVLEMKKLVKALHRAGIELVLEFFFTGGEDPYYVDEALRSWVREYHIDGIHLIGAAPVSLLAADPYLADTKIWSDSFGEEDIRRQSRKHLGLYDEKFKNEIRRVLKGDEDTMRVFAERVRDNPSRCGRLNYLTGSNSFTLADMVSYERKNNLANGENNRDGSDYNYTWNCGVEGPTRKRTVLSLRRQQTANALAFLFLSQGTPVLQAGDEFGNSQNGNNNAYCQDNEISWLNWRQLKNNNWLFEYVKELIAFRKTHPVFAQNRELLGSDTLGCGCPDISFHGAKAWIPEFDVFSRKTGIFLNGSYASLPDGSKDASFYIACNMYREPGELALPNLPRPYVWRLIMDTSRIDGGAFVGQEGKTEDVKSKVITVPAHTIQIFIGEVGADTRESVDSGRKKSKKRCKNGEN